MRKKRNPIPDYTPYVSIDTPQWLRDEYFPEKESVDAFEMIYSPGLFVILLHPTESKEASYALITEAGEVIYKFEFTIPIENILRTLTKELKGIDILSMHGFPLGPKDYISNNLKAELKERAMYAEEAAMKLPIKEKIKIYPPEKLPKLPMASIQEISDDLEAIGI